MIRCPMTMLQTIWHPFHPSQKMWPSSLSLSNPSPRPLRSNSYQRAKPRLTAYGQAPAWTPYVPKKQEAWPSPVSSNKAMPSSPKITPRRSQGMSAPSRPPTSSTPCPHICPSDMSSPRYTCFSPDSSEFVIDSILLPYAVGHGLQVPMPPIGEIGRFVADEEVTFECIANSESRVL